MPLPKFLAALLATEVDDREDTALLFGSGRGGHLTEGEVRWVFDPAANVVASPD